MPVTPGPRPRPCLDALRATLAPSHAVWPAIPFGVPPLDAALPGGGLARGALHEVAGSGPEVEHAAAAALFVGGILARLPGPPVLWVLQQADLFAPALAGVGLHPDRVIYAVAERPATVLLALEDALRAPGLAGVVGELFGRLTLTASRRLQLASEAVGVPAFVLRRSRRHDDPVLAEPCAAFTRWRVGALPSAPPLPDAPEVPGLGRARWRLRADPLPWRRGEILDGGGVRCAGSSR